MNAERFSQLAEAYGGDVRRWPGEEGAMALDWLEANPAAGAILADAGALDALLAADAPLAASGILRERILAGAPRSRPVWSRASTWASGAALAAACAAGIFVGGVNSARWLAQPTTSVASAARESATASPAATTTAAVPTTSKTDAASETPDVYYGGAWFSGLESNG